MINLEQIQKLEARVTKAVELIKALKAENQALRRTLDSAQSRMQELESLVGDFRNDQKDIEECILRALENLNELEDEISDRQADTPEKKPRNKSDQEPQEENDEVDEEAEDSLPFEAREVEGKPTGGSDGSGELDIF
jgi:predicted  nucleic acid-binding Zn-ribbon protein